MYPWMRMVASKKPKASEMFGVENDTRSQMEMWRDANCDAKPPDRSLSQLGSDDAPTSRYLRDLLEGIAEHRRIIDMMWREQRGTGGEMWASDHSCKVLKRDLFSHNIAINLRQMDSTLKSTIFVKEP